MAITERRDTHGNLIGFSGIRSGRAEKEDLNISEHGTKIWSGYENVEKDVRKGEIVLGNSQEHKAMIASYNDSMEKRLNMLKEQNPTMDAEYLDRLRNKMMLKVGDYISYTADKAGNMSTWKVERGGEVIQNLSAKDTAGDTKSVSQDRAEYKGGTHSDGVLTGAIEQVARGFGASEETAKAWGARVAAVQGMIKDVTGIIGGGGGGSKTQPPPVKYPNPGDNWGAHSPWYKGMPTPGS